MCRPGGVTLVLCLFYYIFGALATPGFSKYTISYLPTVRWHVSLSQRRRRELNARKPPNQSMQQTAELFCQAFGMGNWSDSKPSNFPAVASLALIKVSHRPFLPIESEVPRKARVRLSTCVRQGVRPKANQNKYGRIGSTFPRREPPH